LWVGGNRTGFKQAVGSYDVDIARILIEGGADVEQRDELGFTAWLLAARGGLFVFVFSYARASYAVCAVVPLF
jgi:ankyrin repeat protein